MAQASFWKMGMLCMKHDGFTLIECMIALLILSSFTVLIIGNTTSVPVDHYYFMNDYLKTQTSSLVNKSDSTLNNSYITKHISFNSSGKVNRADTISFKNHDVIIHLGSGYLSYE